jgi:predicted nucleic acid-binding protein
MILADSSIWIDHLHRNNAILADLLEARTICGHAMLTGELAMGSYRQRDSLISDLQRLTQMPLLTEAELLAFVGAHTLFGKGLSYVDAHFLGSALVGGNHRVWTRDKALYEAAKKFDLTFDPVH